MKRCSNTVVAKSLRPNVNFGLFYIRPMSQLSHTELGNCFNCVLFILGQKLKWPFTIKTEKQDFRKMFSLVFNFFLLLYFDVVVRTLLYLFFLTLTCLIGGGSAPFASLVGGLRPCRKQYHIRQRFTVFSQHSSWHHHKRKNYNHSIHY